MKNKEIKQGEIYMADLCGMDSEQKGVHPVLVISTQFINRASPNVIVFPITHRDKKRMPFHYILYKKDYDFFLYERNTVQPECMKHISINRLQRYIGKISKKDISSILQNKEYVFIEKK